MNIDTTEAGGGSYPEPPEPKEKWYTFVCDCSLKAHISVWAKNLEEAENRIKSVNYDDYSYENLTVDDILSYEIEG